MSDSGIKHGDLSGPVLQSGSELVKDNDGTVSGTAIYHCPIDAIERLPDLGDAHPYHKEASLFRQKFTFLKKEKLVVTNSYFGLFQDPTPYDIRYPASVGRESIETHPNFAAFAGVPGNEANGAKFDSDGVFLGFLGHADQDEAEKFGVRSYFVPDTTVYLSYWTSRAPKIQKQCRKFEGKVPKDVIKPPEVVDWFLLANPYQKAPNSPFYQVIIQLIGLDRKVDTDIYPPETKFLTRKLQPAAGL